MSRFKFAALLSVALSAAACHDNVSPPLPTTPSPPSVTDTFSGTLTLNGASTYAFSVSGLGFVYATLTSITDSSAIVGLSLGTWNGAACATVIANDQATQGTVVTGTVAGLGTLCARVYDTSGKVVSPLDYQITVTHP